MAAGRRHGGSVVLVVFLLLGVLVALGLYAGDGYALRRAESAAGSQLQGRLGTPAAPTVDIEGRPFLTQVAARHLRTVHVVADDLGAAAGTGSTVPVQHADLVLSDVTTTDWFQSMTAKHVDGTALLAYGDLGSLSSVPLSYAGDGRLQVVQATSIFGATLSATITGTPQLDVGAQTLTLADPAISLGSVNLPKATADALMQSLLKPIPVEGLPFGLTLSSISAEDDGLHAGLTGNDIEFRR
ncbi:DUF2993 domain-containing protein [uncultured Friedmanniella sp.]|uniref:LmeA family phospholipid-binding protein n=1 Tax=uncultured Friedmanniella sp. TaxID=335381 RepID=UPI0035CC3BDA